MSESTLTNVLDVIKSTSQNNKRGIKSDNQESRDIVDFIQPESDKERLSNIYEIRSKIESTELDTLIEIYGVDWFDNLSKSVNAGGIESSQICDYATLLYNSMTSSEVEAMERILGSTVDISDGKQLSVTDDEKEDLEIKFSVQIYNSLPRLVQSVLIHNKIPRETMVIYANTRGSLSTTYGAVLKWAYQSYKIHESLSNIENIFDYDIFNDPYLVFKSYPNFSDVLENYNSLFGEANCTLDYFLSVSREYEHALMTIKTATRHFFIGDIIGAYNAMVDGGIDLTPVIFVV